MQAHLKKPIRLLMFDLDGTLVDSVPDLAYAVDAMLRGLGRSPAGIDKVRCWVGNGAAMLVKRALSGTMLASEIDEHVYPQAYRLFLEHYQHINGKKSLVYPHVAKTLSLLRARYPYLALITNKPEQFTQPLLSHHDIVCFDQVICGDTLATKKPNPEPLLYCLNELACKPEEALMVGDSLSDIKAAKAAGVPIACVSYGYNQGEDLVAYQPDYFIDDFKDLLRLLTQAEG